MSATSRKSHHRPRRSWAIAGIALVVGPACGSSGCPEGRVEESGRCVLPSKHDSDAGSDAATSTSNTGGDSANGASNGRDDNDGTASRGSGSSDSDAAPGSSGSGAGGRTSAPDSGGAPGSGDDPDSGDEDEDAGSGDAMSPDGSDGPDLVAPTVVSVTPEDGARGVAKDSSIVVRFSEPMDRALAEGAFHSSTFVTGSMTWSEGDTVLTVEPVGLTYTEGEDPSTTAARNYEYSVTTIAADKAGNALKLEQNASFSTLRRLTHVYELGGSGVSTSGRTENKEVATCSTQEYLVVGDGGSTDTYQAFLQIDLALLAANVRSIVNAHFTMGTDTVDDVSSLTPFLVERIAVDNIHAPQTGPVPGIGAAVSTSILASNSAYEFDVTDFLSGAMEEGNRAQMRLRFTVANDGDGMIDAMEVSCATSSIEVEYLAP